MVRAVELLKYAKQVPTDDDYTIKPAKQTCKSSNRVMVLISSLENSHFQLPVAGRACSSQPSGNKIGIILHRCVCYNLHAFKILQFISCPENKIF